MMREKRAPTLRDVAHVAGVSPYTVSAVFNGARSNTRVSEATRSRIMEIAHKMNYHPNAMARGLAKRRSNVLGIFFGILNSPNTFVNTYATGLLHGVAEESAHHAFDILLYTESWKETADALTRFRDGRCDGVILVAPLMDTQMMAMMASLPVPLVVISPDPNSLTPSVPWVDVDNVYGITLAVEHLVSLGHRRIAHVTGNQNVASVVIRRAAFEQAMAKAGLPARPEYLIPASYDGEMVKTVLPPVLGLPEPPTAIVAGNDNIALAAFEVARNLQLSLPDDLSIVGFDDIATAEKTTPKLTTVQQPLNEIGRIATRLLIERICEKPAENSISELTEIEPKAWLVKPTLIVRESTAPPRIL